MKTTTTLGFALFTAALMLLPNAAARSETQSFVAGNGTLVVYTAAITGSDVGGNRFFLGGSEVAVTVTVSEASTNSLIWYNGAGTRLASTPFCTSGTFDVPAGAARFTVFVGSDVTGLASYNFSCGVAAAPASGTITADFV